MATQAAAVAGAGGSPATAVEATAVEGGRSLSSSFRVRVRSGSFHAGGSVLARIGAKARRKAAAAWGAGLLPHLRLGGGRGGGAVEGGAAVTTAAVALVVLGCTGIVAARVGALRRLRSSGGSGESGGVLPLFLRSVLNPWMGLR